MKLAMEDGSVELGGRSVLRDVTLSFEEGAVTGILGPNGAGKSTLLRALTGLVPLAAGRVKIDWRDLSALSRREVARRVGYLPQSTEVPFSLPIEDVVMMGRYAHVKRFGSEGPEDRRAVDAALSAVDADSLKGRPVNELSGGERQRVLLARTLATEASVLLLDEPTANLDIRHCLDLLDILRGQAADGRTIAVAIHDLNLAQQFCDRLLLVHDGRLVAEGTTNEVLLPGLMRKVFEVETHYWVHNGERHYGFSRRIRNG